MLYLVYFISMTCKLNLMPKTLSLVWLKHIMEKPFNYRARVAFYRRFPFVAI